VVPPLELPRLWVSEKPEGPAGSLSLERRGVLRIDERHQLANFADLCNDCGNCDVFCLEDGGPYLAKPRLFVDRERWLADAPRDAVLIETDATTARFGGEVVSVAAGQGAGDDPRARALKGLREALLDPGEVNHVSEYLRARVSG